MSREKRREVRSVFKVGDALVVTLPVGFCRRHKLKRGDRVVTAELSMGTLMVYKLPDDFYKKAIH